MGIIKRQAFHNTAISFSGAFLGYINFLILLPYAFLPEQIGLVRILQNASSLFVPLAQLGIISAIIRYYPFFKDDVTKKRSFFLYSILISMTGFMLFIVLFFVFKNEIINLYIDQSPMLLEYYELILPLTLFLLLFGVLEAFANTNFKTAVPIFLRDILLRFCTTIIAVSFIYGILDFTGFIWLLVAAYGFNLLILIIYLFRIGELNIGIDFSFLKKGFFKEIFTYSLFVLLGSTGALFLSYIDILMIGAIIGLGQTGIYATSYFMAVVIDIPRRSIKQIVDPFISVAIKNDDQKQLDELYKKVSINQLLIGFLLVLGIWINIDEIFEIMPNGDTYSQGKYVVLIIMIAKLFEMGTSINGEIIGYSRYYRFNIFALSILGVLAVVTNLYFIPIYGINGAALATLISILLFNLIKYVFVLLKMKMQPFTLNTVKVIALALITFLLVSQTPVTGNSIVDIFIKSSFVVVIYGGFSYLLKISEDFNITINKFFSRFI